MERNKVRRNQSPKGEFKAKAKTEILPLRALSEGWAPSYVLLEEEA
jgi:hypothetical protein